MGLVAKHVVGGDLGLSDGVAPVLQRHELVVVDRMRETRHVARHEDVVGDQAVDVDGAAARIGGHPPGSCREARAFQPFDVADRAERDHGHVGLDPAAVGQPRAGQPPLRVSFQRGDRDPAAQVHARGALHGRSDVADHLTERADQRGGPCLNDGHLQAQAAADRRHLRAGESRPDDQHPVDAGGQPLAHPVRLVERAQHVHAVELRLRLLRPRPGARAGRDQHLVEPDPPAVGEAHLLGGDVQPCRGRSRQPFDVDLAQVGKHGVLGVDHACQHLLGQRRPVVRLVLLVPDESDRALEAVSYTHL